MGKELYLYAQYPMLLCRLNLSKLSDTDLEVIHDFRNQRYPEGMGMMIVDSKPYLFGGEKVSPVPVDADEYEYQSTEEIFCFDAYLLDPTSREDPLVSVGSIPKLGGPKIRPIVVTIERKTYVLTRPPLLSSFYELKGPHFEVFDHGNRTWERVNDPPVFDRERGKTIVTYFAWGHRLLLRTLGGLSIFDTRKLIWEDGRWFLDQLRKWPFAAPFPTGTAAEIEGGFYIALSIDKNELVAYEFDPDGVLKSYRVLDEISDVFSSEPQLGLEYCTGFVTRIGGDGRMCFVFGGPTFGEWSGVRVAVFRVSAVTGGLSVDVECLKFFDLQDFDPIHYTIDSIMVIRYSQDSMSSVGSGYTENCDNSGEKTSLYPPIDDLISNVHISDNAGTVPASPSAPAANSVSSSPMNLHTQSAKYETEGNTYGNYESSHSGKWDASHSGPMDSTSHLALSHSSSFIDSPHSQSLQVVPFSTSKGSLKVLLLHGNLDIWVYEAKNLPNMDMFRKIMSSKLLGNMSSKIEGTMNHKITSDPYVSISVSSAVIGRTYVISNSEDPVWMQRFYVPVAHYAAEVHFLVVKDSDVVGSQLMGVVAIPVEQIYSGAKVHGFYPILNSNGKPCKPGAVLSLSIQYTPIDNLSIYHHGVGAGPDYFGVPGTYFPLRKGGTVTLYQDAHVPDDFFPNLKIDNGRKYVQGKCWRDIFYAICQARRLVYITGWSVWHQVRLVRDADNASVYTLGDLLKSKSQEGVRVLLLVWDDPTSRSILGYKTDGVMQTHDEETRRFFKHSLVQVLLCPHTAGKKHSWVKQREVGTIYTHHQKTVIVDADAGDNRRKIVAFLGGLDLCDGRYDTPQHPIFRTLRTVHSDDYHNPTFTGHLAGCPREPWHDLHCKIDGPAAYDVLTNFEEHWLKASKPHGIKKLKMSYDDSLLRIDRMPEIAGLMDTPCVSEYDPEGWHVQIFRSIDSNSVRKFPNDPKEAISKNLMCGKNVLIDMSIHTAYVKAIRAAQHYIYIENQYFIGSSYNWSAHKDLGANNLIPMEIALKIADKIRAHERFSAYVVIPMWPEGNPTGAATQRILFWQHKTMQMMYETIYKALVEVGLEDAFTPQDYLNFYCLGNREVVGNDISPPSTESPAPANSPQALSRKNRRFMIYVHSKGMIVDDEFVILGSANINQRSIEGTRDTEIAMGAYQPHHTWARKSSNPQGQIYGYRMSLWAEHLGIIEDCFSRPESVDCVRKVRSMGEANWKQFASDEVTEMKGHLMKYPVEVDRKGKVRPLPGCESFPDVGGQIVGSFLAIQENLTI